MNIETLNHCHVEAERGWLFHSEDTQTTEDEYLQLLYALVYCLKPESVLETGTFKGYGSAAIAKGLRKNGFGKLTTVEFEPKAAVLGQAMLETNGVAEYAEVVNMDSIEYLTITDRKFDFALFDSQLMLRCQELQICLDRGLLTSGAVFAMHDTSRLRTITPGVPDPLTKYYWEQLEATKGIKFIEFPLSRGLTLAQVL